MSTGRVGAGRAAGPTALRRSLGTVERARCGEPWEARGRRGTGREGDGGLALERVGVVGRMRWRRARWERRREVQGGFDWQEGERTAGRGGRGLGGYWVALRDWAADEGEV